MAAIPASSDNPDNTATRIPSDAGNGDELRRWIDYAVEQTSDLKQALVDAADSAAVSAGSGLSKIRSVSSSAIQDAKGFAACAKKHFVTYEDLAVGKIKEGIIVAAAHPEISSGVAAGVGLLVLKRPRHFLIGNVRRIFLSEESLLSHAEVKVNQLRQSVNLIKNESKKLEERALKAEEEIEQARMSLIKEGREVQGKLRYLSKIEREADGVKDLISELPRREASQYHSEVSALVSQAKKEKKVLSRAASKIINYGIPL